jgi:hypothetical protein
MKMPVIYRARNPATCKLYIAKNQIEAKKTVNRLNAKSRIKDWVWG